MSSQCIKSMSVSVSVLLNQSLWYAVRVCVCLYVVRVSVLIVCARVLSYPSLVCVMRVCVCLGVVCVYVLSSHVCVCLHIRVLDA